MRRRTLFQSLGALLLARPFARLTPGTQRPADLSTAQVTTLRAIADVTLPESIGADAREAVVDRFVAWVKNYREGADMGHGYGSSALRRPSGPSPALQYPGQFAALDAAAVALGAASFAALPGDRRRSIVEAHLNGPERVTRLPAAPTGANLVADFMGFYFNSPDAYDVCYGRDIGADRCRSLTGSEQEPARLGSR
jgi:hypothetical protein